eukprot:3072263-Amphidinium_carterae.1
MGTWEQRHSKIEPWLWECDVFLVFPVAPISKHFLCYAAALVEQRAIAERKVRYILLSLNHTMLKLLVVFEVKAHTDFEAFREL